jgi:beta-lactamase class A
MEQKALQILMDRAVEKTFAEFAGRNLQSDQLAVSLLDLRDAKNSAAACYRAAAPTYPASVVKLFYLAAAHRQMEDGRLKDTPELRDALRDMIVDSGNESTGYVLDLLTGTTSGPELPPAELESWRQKREAVNLYFSSLGYTGVNASKKTWNDRPYGRDRQILAEEKSARNFLTAGATARLLSEIVLGKIISPARCSQMMELLQRDFARTDNADRQANEFIGRALPPGSKLWSKAGYMSQVRHDAAYAELPDGARFVLVIFTAGHSDEKEIIPFLARQIIENYEAA